MRTVIIGAGILGASAAFHLARAGAEVTVIDARLDGRATAAGAGIICPWVSGIEDKAFYRLYADGGEYYPELIAALAEAGETDTGYRRTGAMLVSADPSELAWLDRTTRQRQAPAMGAVTRLSPAEARAAFLPLRPDLGAVHVAGGARVDGRRLAASLLRAAERMGARILQGRARPVVGAGRVTGVTLDEATLPADRVILCAGAWANRLVAHHPPVTPQRGQIVHLLLPDQDTSAWPVILPPGSHYIVPFDNGRIVVGATRESGSNFDYRITLPGLAEVLTQALAVAPGLADAALIEARVGFRPVSAAGRPVLGWVEGIEGLATGNGLGAAGLTIGPLAGRLLADMVLDRPLAVDIAAFSPAQSWTPAREHARALR